MGIKFGVFSPSLKKLYLVGNKKNEVKGFYWLKLTVLDLHFNKISTSNVSTNLQQTIIPCKPLAWKVTHHKRTLEMNIWRKFCKVFLHIWFTLTSRILKSTLKDAIESSIRLGIIAHQFNRELRLKPKATRKSNHGLLPINLFLHQLIVIKVKS